MRSNTASSSNSHHPSTSSKHHKPSHSSTNSKPNGRNYKLIEDKELGGKELIRRYDGHIPGHPKYDVKLPLSDPRPMYLKFRSAPILELPVPRHVIDDNTVGVPPKREVTIFELNDNVNKQFLQQMASKVGKVDDLCVFFHPTNKKHLGMAMIVFERPSYAVQFIQLYNDKPVMGSSIKCLLDPYMALLSERYENDTNTSCPVPIHLKGISRRLLTERRSQICSINKGPSSLNPELVPTMASDSAMDVVESEQSDIDVVGREDEHRHEPIQRRNVPPLDQPTPSPNDFTPLRSDSGNRGRTPTTPTPGCGALSQQQAWHNQNMRWNEEIKRRNGRYYTEDDQNEERMKEEREYNNRWHEAKKRMHRNPQYYYNDEQYYYGRKEHEEEHHNIRRRSHQLTMDNDASGSVMPPLPPSNNSISVQPPLPIPSLQYVPPPPYSFAAPPGSLLPPYASSTIPPFIPFDTTCAMPYPSLNPPFINIPPPPRVIENPVERQSKKGRTPSPTEEKESRQRRREEKDVRRKRKKRKRHSSSRSTSSESGMSLNSGEYLRVKQKSLKYISREKEGREKTIVEQIKTVTKYKRTDTKRRDTKASGAGLQKISSNESDSEEERTKEAKKSSKKKSRSDKKNDGHRWSSSSSDSDEVRKSRYRDRKDTQQKREMVDPMNPIVNAQSQQQTREVAHTAGLHQISHAAAAAPLMPHTPIASFGSPPMPSTMVFNTPTHLPPPNYHTPSHSTPTLIAGFNPSLPPPSATRLPDVSIPPPTVLNGTPVRLRLIEPIEDTFHPSQQTTSSVEMKVSSPKHVHSLADRISLLFGKETTGSATPDTDTSRVEMITDYEMKHEAEDMDIDEGSPIQETEEERIQRIEEEKRIHLQRMEEYSTQLCGVVLQELRTELSAVLVKDMQKKIEAAAFEELETLWAKRVLEMEESKRQQARESVRAEMENRAAITPTEPNPSNQELVITPEKIAQLPMFGQILPKLPSFLRKNIRPSSPKSKSCSSRSGQSSDDSDDESRKDSSDDSSLSESDDDNLHRRRKPRISSSDGKSIDDSSSSSSSADSEPDEESEEQEDKATIASSVDTQEKDGSVDASTDGESDESAMDEATIDMDKEQQNENIVDVITDDIQTTSSITSRILEETNMDRTYRYDIVHRSNYHTHHSEHCYPKTFQRVEDEVDINVAAILSKVQTQITPTPSPKKEVKKKTPKKENRIPNEVMALLEADLYRSPTLAKKFEKRSEEEDRVLLTQWEGAFDIEDQGYLYDAWKELQDDGKQLPPWKRNIPFQSYPYAPTPRLLANPSSRLGRGRLDSYYDDDEMDGVVPHNMGCARAQGYYKLDVKTKRSLIRRPEGYQDKTEVSERDLTAVRHQVQANKESRSMQRRLLTTMGDTNTDFFKVNQLKFRKKMIKFARSRIHGWGLYALEPIAPDDMIVEYVGQKVRPSIADEREKAYERRGIGSSYLFRIDETCVIDATKMGNFARFINHSCQPNCYAKVVTVDGDRRIVIYSKCLINKGDEITYDYKFPIEDDKIDCLCGAPNCRGTLN